MPKKIPGSNVRDPKNRSKRKSCACGGHSFKAKKKPRPDKKALVSVLGLAPGPENDLPTYFELEQKVEALQQEIKELKDNAADTVLHCIHCGRIYLVSKASTGPYDCACGREFYSISRKIVLGEQLKLGGGFEARVR